ncbi:zinc-finger homeodomain protein 6 [Punica granatum]|uniref:Zinc-finger homeodomain protein 6 n=2 Tax=Punica granatum TaxID=22663 RepID=A0A6P8E260_PUNGR|nr:zinc-finger homeodomain protein 6 [Punica granatum]XP_031399556.1 zinc-finger homeodomain protein 6 [Punica granatum]PKI58023.1 hypothetical protein CRG98_021603 [Punica granatum]
MERRQLKQPLDHLIHPYNSTTTNQYHNQQQEQQQSHDHQTLDPVPSGASPRTPRTGSIRYRECLKNHAAKMGGHVTDGCGEFMPSGEEDCGPDFFKCAACGCHRNFHRKEPVGVGIRHLDPAHKAAIDRMFSPSSAHPPVMMTFGGGAESSSEDRDLMFRSDGGYQGLPSEAHKKRFRTKFKTEQKEAMAEFAEKIGWKIQKEDEQEIMQFCAKVGVKRQVFKVWMHNNKLKRKKKEQQEL